MYADLTILSLFVFLYSILAGRLERAPLSGPILFAVFGLVLGPLGMDVLTLKVDAGLLRILAEVTLALVLFTDAANADLRVLDRSFRIPERLLLIGLPLTILLGFGVGLLVFHDLGLLEVAILASALAPTDAALGKAVVTNEAVPAKIREGLNLESGLNDGICVPVFLTFLTLAVDADVAGSHLELVLGLVAEEIGIGLAVGVGLTLVGTRVLRICDERGWVTETWRQLPVVGLSMGCFAMAQWLGGSGFIAAFSGGLLFGFLEKGLKHRLLLAAEGTGDTLALITWVTFGAGVVGQVIGYLSWQVLVYSIASLSLIRMLPVFLSLQGQPLRPGDKLFVGWFGPRGLASIVFGEMVMSADLPDGETLVVTIACTILLSILFHGLSANPLVGRIGREAGR
jgi:NhaP-type Na+/H+ or K+/H+ antiporter